MVKPSRLERLSAFALQNVFGFDFGFAVGFQQLSTEAARFY